MTKFASGSDLTDLVRLVISGTNLRCGVAFWGQGSARFLEQCGADVARAKVLCDVEMGGTSAAALRELGAPNNPNLRCYGRLHAKVYLSDRGVVVGSANASNGGLGFGANRQPAHLEVGTYHDRDSAVWLQASEWFDILFHAAPSIDEAALATAERRYVPIATTQPPQPGSLLARVRANPTEFDGIGFVFVSQANSADQLSAAKRETGATHPELSAEIAEWSTADVFTGWDEADVRRWPTSFVEYWMPNTKLSVIARTKELHSLSAGAVFSKRDRALLRALPSAAQIRKVDAALARQIIERHGNRLFSAIELARELEGLEDEGQ